MSPIRTVRDRKELLVQLCWDMIASFRIGTSGVRYGGSYQATVLRTQLEAGLLRGVRTLRQWTKQSAAY